MSALEEMQRNAARPAGLEAADVRPRPPRTTVGLVRAQELLGASGRLQIDLDGEVYTLRLTRNHRLILTK